MFQVLAVIFALTLLVNFLADFLRKGMVNWHWREKRFWVLALVAAIQLVFVMTYDPRGLGGNFYLLALVTTPVLFLFSVGHAISNLSKLMAAPDA